MPQQAPRWYQGSISSDRRLVYLQGSLEHHGMIGPNRHKGHAQIAPNPVLQNLTSVLKWKQFEPRESLGCCVLVYSVYIYIYCYNHHVISCYIMLYHVRSCYIMLYLGCLPAVPIKSHWERDILTSRSPLPVLWDSPSSPNELKLAEPGHRSFLGKAAVQRQTGNERLLGLA